jgi:hypothetical protein
MLNSLGKVTVPAPGTIVRATVNQPDPTKRVACHAFMVQALKANTGRVYIGIQTLSVATSVGLLAVLAIPTNNTIPAFSATISYAPSPLNLADVWIDADVPNEGVLISFVVG